MGELYLEVKCKELGGDFNAWWNGGKKASERAWWSNFSPHFVKNIRRFILKTEARREYYCHV